MKAGGVGVNGWQWTLLVHFGLAALAVWPAIRLLGRAGLPRGWVVWLALPVLGWPIFTSLLAFKPWPTLPPRPEKLHPRERLRRARDAAAAQKGK
ncbi:hypothetical protein GE253_03420 [Niveispirillum sp. SYP-B3756]|uniref:hypothetical protein n=1 Tax=Niveispirillum sp. SYP-B3756 TaxID=2662178 RepID=UPI001291C608|nr:hypothetical protein [Niveispirillum sp. SYP-B3756]MQP64388.1 hypothetical protein [Niveispirillum sp. SYP-B3756]